MKSQTNVTRQNTTKDLAVFSLKAFLLSLAAVLIIAAGIGLAIIMMAVL